MIPKKGGKLRKLVLDKKRPKIVSTVQTSSTSHVFNINDRGNDLIYFICCALLMLLIFVN